MDGVRDNDAVNRPQHDGTAEERRAFLKRAGKGAALSPAVALLLAASSRPAAAQDQYGGGEPEPCQPGCGMGCL